MDTVTVAANKKADLNYSNTQIILGDNVIVTIYGSGNVVTGGNGVTVIDAGNNNSVNLGNNAVLTINGTSDHDSAGTLSVGTVNGSNNGLVVGGGSTLILNGSNNAGNAAGGSTTYVNGNADGAVVTGGWLTITGANDAAQVLNGSVATITASASNATVWSPDAAMANTVTDGGTGDHVTLGNNSTLTVTGTGNTDSVGANSTATVTGSHNSLTTGTGATVTIGSFDGASVGAGSTVVVAGTMNGVSASGSTVTLNAGASTQVNGDNDAITTKAGSFLNLDGSNDHVALGVNGAAIVSFIAGSNDSVDGSNGTINLNGDNVRVNVAGSDDTIKFSGVGDYVGLLGGSGYQVNGNDGTVATSANTGFALAGNRDTVFAAAGDALTLAGASDIISAWDHASGTITGSGNTLTETGNNVSFNVQNTGGGASTVNLNGVGDYVGLLGGSGYQVNGNDGTVATLANTGFVLAGNRDTVFAAAGDALTLSGSNNVVSAWDHASGTITGSGNTLTETGNNVSFNVQNTGGGASTVNLNGAGDYVGLLGGTGYAVNGSNGSVATWANTDFSLVGSNNAVSLSQGDSLAAYGGGNVIANVGPNDAVFLSGTGGAFDTVYAANDTGGFAANGGVAGVYLDSNSAANLFGSNNTISLSRGGTLGAYGGGNTINAGAGDAVVVGGTGANFDTVRADGDAGGGTTEAGVPTGVALNAHAAVNLFGSGNQVTLTGGDDTLGAYGGGNRISAQAGDAVVLGDTGNDYDVITATGDAGGGATATGNQTGISLNAGAKANLAGSGNQVTLVGDNTLGLLAGSGGGMAGLFGGTSNVVDGSNDTINALDGAGASIVGSGNTVNAGGTGDAFNLVGSNDTARLGAGNYVGVIGGSGDTLIGSDDLFGSTPGSSFVLAGNSNTIGLSDGATFALSGSGNAVFANSDVHATLSGDGNSYAATSGGSALFYGQNNSAAVNGTALYSGDGNVIAVTGAPANPADLQYAYAHSPATQNAIDEAYYEVLGRGADPGSLASFEDAIQSGTTLADIRTSLANSQELVSDVNATYAAIGVSGPTAAETAAFQRLMSADYAAPIALIGRDGTLADAGATNLLAELPVLETLAGGRTLSLGLADGTTLQFQDTARLTDFLYAVAAQKSQASTFVTDTFHQDVAWLDQVDQPMLNVAQNLEDLAAYDSARNATDQATLAHAAARIALRIAAEAPGTRGQLTEKVGVSGHETKVTVFANTLDPFGGATYHDIDPGIGGILEVAGLAVLNIAAAVFPETGLPYAAAAADAAEAGKDFANGQILDGILQLAAAAGTFEIGLGGGNSLSGATQTGKVILTAAEGVGGVYGAVQSAQSGDALGVLAGVLEASAAVGSGIGQYSSDKGVVTLANQLRNGLAIASTALTTADAFSKGNIAGGLVSSLSYILSNVATDYIAEQQSITDAVSESTIKPITVGTPAHIAFVGGFFDHTLNFLTGRGPIESYATAYTTANPGADVKYFTFDQGSKLADWIQSTGGDAVVIGHSYGADTAASVVAAGASVKQLVTLDPVSYTRPDFAAVAAHSGQWTDYNATGGGLTFPNIVAGIGSAWGTSPQGYASTFADIGGVDHADIAGRLVIDAILGIGR